MRARVFQTASPSSASVRALKCACGRLMMGMIVAAKGANGVIDGLRGACKRVQVQRSVGTHARRARPNSSTHKQQHSPGGGERSSVAACALQSGAGLLVAAALDSLLGRRCTPAQRLTGGIRRISEVEAAM